MGYYNYQNGLIYRHLHQEGGWDEHLEKCRNYILNSIGSYSPDKVTIIGSGWLLDLPLAEMLEITKKVCLIDIIHPPEVISQVKSLHNVELIEADVTGGLIEEVWKKAREKTFSKNIGSVFEINIPEFIPGSDPGMIVSLNIMTQLESLLVDFLKKKSDIGEEELKIFRKQIQQKHLSLLNKYLSVLICDYEEVYIDKTGNLNPTATLLADIPTGKNREEWIWKFDLKQSDFYNKRSFLKIMALILNNEKI